jgi:glycosyltransferase involved in cell wall biosynthesis
VTRVLFISAEPVGAAMAGPAIRVLELAKAVAAECRVTVAAPAPSDVGGLPLELVEAHLSDFERLLAAVRACDVVVAQRLPPQLLRYVARMPVRFVADLYNPQMIEVLEAVTDGAAGSPRRAWKSMLGQCAVADFVMCASEKQRDLWLGGMGMAGLIEPRAYRADPTFRRFVDVVPFGLPDRPPEPAGAVLREMWPQIGADEPVLLWAGGIWHWLDALTPIRALERLRDRGLPAHLAFMGTGRPALDPANIPTSAGAALEFARERGLEGRCVHFNPGWVPYEERGAWLLDADLGVSAHHDHLEARFSFRTRVLDHFWAGLPSVVSGGDSIGELVERHGLGAAVAPEDDEAYAAACAGLLEDRAAHAAAAERVRALAPSLRWPQVARPLVEFCVEHAERPRRRVPPAALARATYGQYLDVLSEAREHHGVAETARRMGRHVTRVVRHRA